MSDVRPLEGHKGEQALKSDALLERTMSQGLPMYIEITSQIERMHRLLLDVIKDEFLRLRIIEVNPVQGLLLYNIGLEEYSAGELRQRGYYQGSNVSYNLKKLVDTGYMEYERSEEDRRSVRVKLTEKGKKIHSLINGLFAEHLTEILADDVWRLSDIKQMRDLLLLLERYWAKRIRFLY